MSIHSDFRSDFHLIFILLNPDGGTMSTAKMVDLDTEAQLFSQIWGWRIRVKDFFSADFSPVPFQYIWKKTVNYQGGDHSYGAAYQSVLSEY